MALAALIVRIGSDITDLNRGLTAADKGVQKLGKKMQRAGRSMTLGLTVPLVAGFALAFKAAEEQAQAMAKLDAVLRATGSAAGITSKHVSDLATQLQKTTTFADETTISAAAVLLTFKSVRNELGQGNNVFDRTIVAAQDMASIFGGDLQQSMVQLVKAIEDPTRGMAALRRVGVTFSGAEEGVIKSLQKAGDLMGAQKIILAALETQFGGTAAAMAKTAGGQMKVALNALGEAGETVGAIVAPVLVKVAGSVRNLADGFQQLTPATQKTILVVAGLVAAIGPLLLVIGKVMTLLPLLKLAFISLTTGPAGLVVVGLGLLALGIYKIGAASRQAKQDVADFKASLEGLSGAELKLKALGIQGRINLLQAEKTRQQGIAGSSGGGFATSGPAAAASLRIQEIDKALKIMSARLYSVGTQVLATSHQVAANVEPLTTPIVKLTELVGAIKPVMDIPVPDLSPTVSQLLRAHELGFALWQDTVKLDQIYDENTKKLLDGNLSMEERIRLTEELLAIEARRAGGPPPIGGTPAPGAPGAKGDSMGTKVGQVLQAGGGGSEIGQMVQAFASFGPMAVLLPVINGALETLGPAFHKLIEPLVEMGRELGEILGPIFEMLAPVVQLAVNMFKALHPVLKVVVTAFSFVTEVIGWMILGIGKLIDSLPFISAKSMINIGKEMVDAAQAARRNTDATENATDAVNKFADSLSNIPRVLNINALRHMVTGGGSGGGGSTGGGGGPGPRNPGYRTIINNGDTYITVPGAGDPRRVAEEVGRVIERTRARGGTSRITLATA